MDYSNISIKVLHIYNIYNISKVLQKEIEARWK